MELRAKLETDSSEERLEWKAASTKRLLMEP